MEVGFGKRQRQERASQVVVWAKFRGRHEAHAAPLQPGVWYVCGRDGLQKFATGALPVISSPPGQ